MTKGFEQVRVDSYHINIAKKEDSFTHRQAGFIYRDLTNRDPIDRTVS